MLAALTALSFWLGRDDGARRQEPISGLDTRLDYALRDFEVQYFDTQGRPAVNLAAPFLTNDASTGIGTVEQPRFRVTKDQKLWTIIAESATVSADREQILLSGGVNMSHRDPVSRGLTEIASSEVILEVSPRVARSSEAVAIVDGGHLLEATGFRVNMGDNSFHLLDQVRGRYVVN